MINRRDFQLRYHLEKHIATTEMVSNNSPENLPIHFTRTQWMKRALTLPIGVSLQRLTQLSFSLANNIFSISKLYIEAKRTNRNLRLVVLTGTLGDIIEAHAVLPYLIAPDRDIIWLVKDKDILEFNPHIKKALSVTSYTETIFLNRILSFLEWTNLEIH